MQHSTTPAGARSGHLKGIAFTVFGVLILTPDGLLTSLVAADVRTALFWRGLFMGLALTAFVLARYGRRSGTAFRALLDLPHLLIAVFFALSGIGFVTSIVTTSVANTLFLVACAPLFSVILARVFLGQRTRLRTVVVILVAMAGMGVIFADGLGQGDLWGNLAAVGTALTWAGMVVVLEHSRIKDPAPALALGGYMIAVVSFLVAPTIAMVTQDFVWIAILGFFILPVSFFLIGLGPQYISAPEVSLIMLLEAVIGPVWAWLFIAQAPSEMTMLGGAIILTTLAVHFTIGLYLDKRAGR
jgi:drug/metabolite transporter (DMT)-like permease